MRHDEYAARDGLTLAGLVRAGEVTPRELLELAIARAEAVEPVIHAIPIRLDERARTEAAAGPSDGPFRGVPFLIKDLSLQIAGSVTTNGCALFRDALATVDSTLVGRYREAGLVTFGRSASPEFGLTTTTESTLFGATRNPWSPDHIAGGSSGGAAAAVAAGVVPLANASDGGGSIRIPASCCGLFGLKPTRMRTPLGPERAEGWNGMSTVHAVSRSVRDSAALLDATHGGAPGDPYCAPPVERPFLEEVGRDPGRLRIALMRAPLGDSPVHPEVLRAVDDAARLCASLGHEVEEARPPLDTGSIVEAQRGTIAVAVRATLDARAAALGRELSEKDVEPATWAMVQHAHLIPGLQVQAARDAIHGSGRVMASFLERFDAILSPTLAEPPAEIGRLSLARPDLDALFREIGAFSPFCTVANLTGQPAMSVPLHWGDDGLPIGVMFAGRFGEEGLLLRLAAQLEAARPWFHRVPVL